MSQFKLFSVMIVLLLASDVALAETITVTWDDDSYYRQIDETELALQPDGSYAADFSDQFLFTLEEAGTLTFTLSIPDNHGFFFQEWIEMSEVAFASSEEPSSISSWTKEDPYYSGSDLVSTWTWDSLAAGDYTLNVSGSAYSNSYPLVDYWMEDVSFTASQVPVPEPATMLLFGTGIAALAALRRRTEMTIKR